MSRVRQLIRARLDLVEIIAHLAERSENTARRFRGEVQATLERLAGMPGIGTQYAPDDPRYGELRYFPISRFRNHLVFYRPTPDGIEVVRVLHGARDIGMVLAEDFGIADLGEDDGSPGGE